MCDEVKFQELIVKTTQSTVQVLNKYNEDHVGADAPAITNVRYCLVSGGQYRHPKVSPETIAKLTYDTLKETDFVGDVTISLADLGGNYKKVCALKAQTALVTTDGCFACHEEIDSSPPDESNRQEAGKRCVNLEANENHASTPKISERAATKNRNNTQ